MPLEIITVPCLSDNYAFLLHNAESGETALVDAAEADPIRMALDERGWSLDYILLTHHHWDHVDGVPELVTAYGAKVIGNAADSDRLPRLDVSVYAAEETSLLGTRVKIFDVSGHTIGHIAYYLPDERALFTADSLMAMGCGRLFEGTPEMMLASLTPLAALPDDVTVYSGHEYTAHNTRFALTVEPDNTDLQTRMAEIEAQRADDIPTVPSQLGVEKATNPFLRCHLDSVKNGVGMAGADDSAVFAEVRNRRNSF